MSVDSVHALRVELAAALRERDAEREFRGAAEAAFAEQLARTEAAESALAAANARADAAEAKLAEALPCGSVLIVTGFDEEVYENHEETIGHVISELRESLAAANARADAAEAERDGLLDLQRKARATVAAMYEAVREAELRPPLATYVEMRREGPDAPLQYYAMKPEKVTGFYGALRERWNGTDVERWAKEFIEARDRVSASESALAAARRDIDAHKEALSDLMKLINDGALVRNIGQDGEPGWTLRAMRLVMALKHAYALVPALASPASAPGEETKR